LLAPKTDSKRVKLSSIPQVRGVYKMTGQYNIIIKVIMAQNPEYLEEFIGLRSQV
jgi:DNA-binding Lrp family transcriptional regulator